MTRLTDAYALIVGIAHYKAINPLPVTVLNDARAVREVLIDPLRGGYDPKHVTLLLDGEATQAALRHALHDLAQKATADSIVLIYLSSHGGRIENGPQVGEYVLPVDVDYASAAKVAQTAISSHDMTKALRVIAARKLLVIFDCCHSGGIGQPKDAVGPVMKGGLSDATYDALKAGRGRVIIASSRSEEPSWVMPAAKNSLFTQHLLAGLNGGIISHDGLIHIFDLFAYVQPKVTRDQPNQHPIFKSELEENFPVAMYLGGKSPRPVAPQPIEPSSPIAPAVKGEFQYDVFIAHADADKKWAKAELLPRLEGAGLTVCVFPRDLEVAVPKIDNQERAVTTSRHTLLVLTPAFLANEWTEFSGSLAQTLDVAARKRRVIPLLKEPCDLPARLSYLTPADFTDPDEVDTAWRGLIRALGATPITTPPQPAKSKDTAAPAKPQQITPAINTAALRDWINASLDNTELTNLCYDYFRPVSDEFSNGMSRTERIQRLIEFCVRRERIPELIERVNAINPAQYDRYKSMFNVQ